MHYEIGEPISGTNRDAIIAAGNAAECIMISHKAHQAVIVSVVESDSAKFARKPDMLKWMIGEHSIQILEAEKVNRLTDERKKSPASF